MLKLKTKWFNKWAEKNDIPDEILLQTLEAVSHNLNVVNLGSGLYKTRVAKTGKGKSGGYRTLLVYQKQEKAIFIYGFSKSDQDNLSKTELKYLKALAKDLLKLDVKDYEKQEKLGNFFRLEEEEK